jgi:hypothetical protein
MFVNVSEGIHTAVSEGSDSTRGCVLSVELGRGNVHYNVYVRDVTLPLTDATQLFSSIDTFSPVHPET